MRGLVVVLVLWLAASGACRAPHREPPHRPRDTALAAPPAPPDVSLAQTVALLEQMVRSDSPPFPPPPGTLARDRPGRPLRSGLERLYARRPWAPLWITAAGHPREVADDALAALRNATEDGLDPTDYGVVELTRLADSLRLAPHPALAARFDAGLSAAFLTFLGDLHLGRVDPRAAGFRLDLPPDQHDLPSLARTAIAQGRIRETIEALRPQLVLYARARQALVRYRHLATAPWPPLPLPSPPLRPGDAAPWLPEVRRRLAALGDLQPDAEVADDSVYRGDLVDAVRRFQERHGLEPDGLLGRATLAALNVTPGRRAEQLALTLERLRWLPDLGHGRVIAVNIPSFHLWAWDSIASQRAPTLQMNVVVGRAAVHTRTPVFAGELQYVVFRPYWDVPPGILRREILPALRRDTGYLAAHDMEIVQEPGDDARPLPPTTANLDLLARGVLRVRQRPGPRNPLGWVKFIFPNEANVYLHATPAQELFHRSRRAFSHGCVRVERPLELAEFVLRGVGGWDRARIASTRTAGPPLRVNLAHPIPVVLFYTTAIVTPDGTVGFYDDLYGHDRRLEDLLAR